MPSITLPLAGITTSEVLTLVVPVAVFIAVAIWYVAIWHQSRDEG
jgi:hypothetical protein